MEPTPAELRHAIRGTLNALKLCVSAFEMPLDTSEKLEFLSDIESVGRQARRAARPASRLPRRRRPTRRRSTGRLNVRVRADVR